MLQNGTKIWTLKNVKEYELENCSSVKEALRGMRATGIRTIFWLGQNPMVDTIAEK